MPRRDDLDEHFRNDPRLRKYWEMFEAQRSRSLQQSQKMAWVVLVLAAFSVYYVMAAKSGSWSPLDWKVPGIRAGSAAPGQR